MDQAASPNRRAEHRKFYAGVADELREYASGWVRWETTNPRYETRSGSGQYLTTRQAYARAGKDVPHIDPPLGWEWLVDLFWRLKRFLPDIVDPITPALVTDYGEALSWSERELLFALDYEMRSALSAQRAENDRWRMEKSKRG